VALGADVTESIETDRYYLKEASGLKRLSNFEKRFVAECEKQLDEGIQMSPTQRTMLQKIIAERSA
jgi:hypothetical protein